VTRRRFRFLVEELGMAALSDSYWDPKPCLWALAALRVRFYATPTGADQ
jgi:hypothetical protein